MGLGLENERQRFCRGGDRRLSYASSYDSWHFFGWRRTSAISFPTSVDDGVDVASAAVSVSIVGEQGVPRRHNVRRLFEHKRVRDDYQRAQTDPATILLRSRPTNVRAAGPRSAEATSSPSGHSKHSRLDTSEACKNSMKTVKTISFSTTPRCSRH